MTLHCDTRYRAVPGAQTFELPGHGSNRIEVTPGGFYDTIFHVIGSKNRYPGNVFRHTPYICRGRTQPRNGYEYMFQFESSTLSHHKFFFSRNRSAKFPAGFLSHPELFANLKPPFDMFLVRICPAKSYTPLNR